MTTAPPRTPASPRASVRRRLLEGAWVLAVVAYGLGRTIVVWQALGDYGVNPWVYGAIDLVSSVPYGFGTARVVTGVLDRDWSRARRWGTIATAAFVAPDVYILLAGESMPWPVYAVLGAWCCVAAVFALRSLRRQIRARRAGPAISRW